MNKVDLSKNLTDKKLFKYNKETPRVHFQNLLKSMKLRMLGTTLVQNGVSIADISVLLGHSSITITEARYANKSKD